MYMEISEVLFVVGTSVVAIWKDHVILYIGAFVGALLLGLNICQTSWAMGIPVLCLAGYMIFRVVNKFWR